MSPSERNALYRLAAGSGLLIGLFFLLGAYGHFAAVGGAFDGSIDASTAKQLALLLPGVILVGTGLINIVLCRALWRASVWALHAALSADLAAAAYLVYLMGNDLPSHPVGAFLALVASYLVLLGAIRAGLVWPAAVGRGTRGA